MNFFDFVEISYSCIREVATFEREHFSDPLPFYLDHPFIDSLPPFYLHLPLIIWNWRVSQTITVLFIDEIVGNKTKRANLKSKVTRKQSTQNFPKKRTFLTH